MNNSGYYNFDMRTGTHYRFNPNGLPENHTFQGETIELSKFLLLVEAVFNKKWLWYKNFNCKYITIHLDKDKNSCQIKNRIGKDISFSQLSYQIGGDLDV